MRERAEQTLRDALVTHLAGKRLLLVLDNFEHLLPAAPLVAELLGACPALRVLTTSRAALHLSGEHLYSVPPLALPDAGRLPPLEELGQTAAVRLFVDRVRAVKPDFALSEANAPAVVEIVRRLDGLPLALELVAARARVLSPAALSVRLDRRLPLLTGGAQDLPERQRTLRDTIAWSYDLLRPNEQTLFRRLGVFAGGCTLEAAETVADLDEPFDVLEGMTALLDASLLQSEEQDAEPRYTMLATIREFALERLSESGEEPATRDRHARFFLDLAERAGPEIIETADPTLLDVIDREHDNLRAALAWSRDTGDHDTLLRLAGALAFFWYYRGYLNEGQRWLDQALETPPDDAAPRPRAWALTASGMLANVCGETDRATALLTESFPWWEQSRRCPWPRRSRAALLGGVYVSQGRYDEAAPLFAANEAYFRDTGIAGRDDDLLGHRALSPRRDRLGAGRRCARPQPAAGCRGALRSLRDASRCDRSAALSGSDRLRRRRPRRSGDVVPRGVDPPAPARQPRRPRGRAGRRGDPRRGARGVAASGAPLRQGGGAAPGRGRGVLPAGA